MFTIRLELCDETLSGTLALDTARRLGLPDTTDLRLAGEYTNQAKARDAVAEVEEGFARAYFHDQQTESTAKVPRRLLAAGDVEMVGCNDYAATFRADVPPARVVALYLAVRFQACRDQVTRLTAQLREARGDVAEIPAEADDRGLLDD